MDQNPKSPGDSNANAPAAPVTKAEPAAPVGEAASATPACTKCGMPAANGQCSGCSQDEGTCVCPVPTAEDPSGTAPAV